ncbi:sulfatase [Nitrosopumilus adriaticus]|uniref:sulfatase family protein n=1 Tax=Nitrosopumilus adriaticus TaxID=1580092 RepID=UPI00352C59ED
MKKNVIIICIDGCRLDRAINSQTYVNPLSGSIFFSQSITYAPYTNSSVHALISGIYGNRNGCNSYWHSYQFRDNEVKTLVEYLHENDFYTYADIHTDLIMPKKGYDEYIVFDESEVNLVERHKNILKYIQSKKEKKNFFLYLHYSSIHTEIMNSVLKPYNNFSEEYFKNLENNNKNYNKFFNESENYLKKIIKHIIDLDMDKNSIIVIFSDHGVSVGEKFGERAYGAFCYDYTIKTFVNYISPERASKKINQQIRHIDVMPSILEDLGIKIDNKFKKLDGVSFIPLVNNGDVKEEIAFSETANPLNDNKPPKNPNTMSVRTSKWKLIFNEHNNTKELYNLIEDPNEEKNLIGTNLKIEIDLWNELLRLKN